MSCTELWQLGYLPPDYAASHSGAKSDFPGTGDGMWSEIMALRGRKLYTLGRSEEFEVLEVTGSGVTVQPSSSGTKRLISKRSLDGAYAALSEHGHLDLAGVRRHNEMNPVYIAAMLAQLPDVQMQRKPKILLIMTKS